MTAGTKAYVRAEGAHLVPADQPSEEVIRRLPAGRTVEINIVRRRSVEQLRFYFGLCSKVAEMLRAMGAEHETTETVDAKLRVATGHCEIVPLPPKLRMATGERYGVLPGRIAFHKLDQDAFGRFVDRCLAFTATELLPHVPTRELRAQVEMMVVPGGRAA